MGAALNNWSVPWTMLEVSDDFVSEFALGRSSQ
jgi:hypothetical protein